MLAKAVAHHTTASFIRVVGSEFVQKYLGEGPRMVRDVFRLAKGSFSNSFSDWTDVSSNYYPFEFSQMSLSVTPKWPIWKGKVGHFGIGMHMQHMIYWYTGTFLSGIWSENEFENLSKENSPSIIFIDEIDAIATKRFDAQTGADREVQRILLELLNQMDGFDQSVNVKVIMATNRQDTLDPALLRPGRLDRKIEFPLPDRRQKVKWWIGLYCHM